MTLNTEIVGLREIKWKRLHIKTVCSLAHVSYIIRHRQSVKNDHGFDIWRSYEKNLVAYYAVVLTGRIT